MTLERFFKLFYHPNKAQAHDGPQSGNTGDGPLEVKRDITDQNYLLLFSTSIACWIIVSIYAFAAGDKIAMDYSNVLFHVEMRQVSEFVFTYISEVGDVFAWDLALSLFLLTVFAVLCRWATKVVIYIFIVLVFVVLGLIYALLFMLISHFHEGYFPVFIMVILTTIYGLALYVLKKTGIEMICKVIRESCKAVFAYPSTLCIVVLQFVVGSAAFAYFISIFGFLYSIRNESFEEFVKDHVELNNTEEEIGSWVEFKILVGGSIPDNYRSVPGHIYLLHAINIMTFLWTVTFISGVGRMILTSTFATWYNNKSERRSPVTTVPRSFTTILRYHLGTVAYASSVFALIPIFKIVYENGREVIQKVYKQPILLLSWLTIFCNSPFDALAVCAIHGHEFYESARDSYKLQIKNISTYLAMNTVSQVLIFLGSLLVPFISSVIGEIYLYKNRAYYVTQEDGYSIASATSAITTILPFFMSFTFFTTFHAASETIRLCYFEDSKFNQEGEMKLYEIQIDDIRDEDF